MNIISQRIITDSRGVQYQETRVRGKHTPSGGLHYPVILRRITKRPVDIKRRERVGKRAVKAIFG